MICSGPIASSSVRLSIGNSVFLPFPRQFIIGGANSLRGFVPRDLGPGSTMATELQQSTYPQIGGDYKLEMNTEFRFPFVRRLKGAVFIDAGNIWMKDTLLYGPAGKLSKNFYKEIAVDGGLGIRLDISLLILRADLGMPFYKPWLPEGERWVFRKISLGSKDWRKENLVWNIAIGYPF
jgi:outer membrane protein assembly factor BamA